MKHILSFLAFSFIAINVCAQIKFEEGYFIDNNDQKVNCLIKNKDWKDNPSQFEYKTSEGGSIKTASLPEIKAFGVENLFKYERHQVEMDRSRNDINHLSKHPQPKFEIETLFLKILVEGKANLYYYRQDDLFRYFYSKNNETPTQFIYKRHIDKYSNIGENNEYKNQLFYHINCADNPIQNLERVTYTKKDFIKLFTSYNECEKSTSTNFDSKQKRDVFNLYLRAGANFSSLKTNDAFTNPRDTDFGTKVTSRWGLEAEFILPFNKNKWSIIFEPTFQRFKKTKQLTSQSVSIDYKSLELNLGLRHYFFTRKNLKLFVNGGAILDYDFNSIIDYEKTNDLTINAIGSVSFGCGLNVGNKYSLEFRHALKRSILKEYLNWDSDFKNTSIILGYNLIHRTKNAE